MINTLGMIGYETVALVLVGVLVVFGGKKIPELMRGIGQGVGELKKGLEDSQRQVVNSIHHEEPKPILTPEPEKAKTEAKVETPV